MMAPPSPKTSYSNSIKDNDSNNEEKATPSTPPTGTNTPTTSSPQCIEQYGAISSIASTEETDDHSALTLRHQNSKQHQRQRDENTLPLAAQTDSTVSANSKKLSPSDGTPSELTSADTSSPYSYQDERKQQHQHQQQQSSDCYQSDKKQASKPRNKRNQKQYPPERRRKDTPIIIRHEELIPLTDHSSSHTANSNRSSRILQSSDQRVGSKVSRQYDYHTNNHNEFNHTYQEFLSLNDYSTGSSEPESYSPTDRSPEYKIKLKKKQETRTRSCINKVTIFLSSLTILLCAVAIFHVVIKGKFPSIIRTKTTSSNDWNGTSASSSFHERKKHYDKSKWKQIEEMYYDELGRYKLEDYDVQSTFSSFLPGLAGYYGKPVYAFYVNRGQGIASFGIESKDFPIQEFQSANNAYQTTPITGFRTFIQGKRSANSNSNDKKSRGVIPPPFLIEPFSPTTSRFLSNNGKTSFIENEFHNYFSMNGQQQQSKELLPKRHMYIGSNEMKIQEIDYEQKVETNVTYHTLPEEEFAAFVRHVTITNTDYVDNTILTISAVDGLARIEPAGGKLNYLLKNMGRTLEGWMGVYQTYNDTLQMPYYRLTHKRQTANINNDDDDEDVVIQEAGHWCLSVWERDNDNEGDGNINDLLPIIYDPEAVFGDDTTLLRPINLYTNSINSILHNNKQYGFAKVPSAFAVIDGITLQPGESVSFTTYFGKAEHILQVPVIARRLLQEGFGQYKMARATEITNQITASVQTHTSNLLFNGHAQQMLLDNTLQGGIPCILGEVDDEARMRNADEDPRLKVFHLFSRTQGDIERDYDDFVIKSTFFSEGPSTYRNVIQNRRSDVLFNPRIGAFNVKMFLSFIQADGYEPLTVEAVEFTIKDKGESERVATKAVGEADGHRAQREALTGLLNAGPFRPGQLFLQMEEQNIELTISRQDFIDMVAATANYSPVAEYKDGFWADHWTYYVDLIDSYLQIYPDWEQRIMFEERLPYFFSTAFVKPRDKKYVLAVSPNGRVMQVRQVNATIDIENEKMNEIQRIRNATGLDETQSNWQLEENGEVFKSSPVAKLFLLATLKFATRDPYGMGIEYESGKPGWNDANNGLSGMLSSGMPETFELVVLIRYILSTIRKYQRDILVPEELYSLVNIIQDSLYSLSIQYTDSEVLYPIVPLGLFRYWDSVAYARENYREQTKVKFTGRTRAMAPAELDKMLERWLHELDLGIQRAMKFGTIGVGDLGSFGVTPTYFSYTVTKWDLYGYTNEKGQPYVRPLEMVVNLFPMFLEGPTRMLKTIARSDEDLSETDRAKRIYQSVQRSPLRDKYLQMYTSSASLNGPGSAMGRQTVYAPGWEENQSVWLSMSYKFYLELLRHKLYDEFYQEMLSGAMLPFMDPKLYGRSLMECSSFIASSAFEDPKVRGRGFLARLSGSTAEYLSMWVLMMIGPNPFTVNTENGGLQLQLVPALPRWLFRDSHDIDVINDVIGGARGQGSPNVAFPYISFKLFGAIDVTYYHNLGNENLFGVAPSRYVVYFRDGTVYYIKGPVISGQMAEKIRRLVFVSTIEVFFEK